MYIHRHMRLHTCNNILNYAYNTKVTDALKRDVTSISINYFRYVSITGSDLILYLPSGF